MQAIVGEATTVTTAAGSTAVGVATKSVLYGFIIEAASADVTVDIEDGTVDAVRYILDISVEGLSKVVTLPSPIRFTAAMNVTVTGAGGVAYVIHGQI